MKRGFFVLVIILVLFSSCEEEKYQLCPDNVTQVLDLANCPEIVPECPVCDDNISCTIDFCGESSNYECRYTELEPCDGNGECEVGEFPWSKDCPFNCDDQDKCTSDKFNFDTKKCYHEDIIPCCGNKQCDTGETFINCELDCEQQVNVKIDYIEKRQRFGGSYYGNLLGSDNMFLVVNFKITNIGIEIEEEIDFKKKKGFYYDPFKMRVEDERGELYSPEIDSDILNDYLDLFVVPKGNTRGAALLFVVPERRDYRFITYDHYGNRLDVDVLE